MFLVDGSPAIRITKRDGLVLYVLLDLEDYLEARHYPWHMTGGKGPVGKYAANHELGLMHRWVAQRAGLLTDETPDGLEADHENGNKLDDRRGNLRLLRRPENMRNPNDGLRKNNTSGFRGVTYMAGRKRPWNASVMEAGRNINLGYFATAEGAAEARKSYEQAPDKAAWLAGRRQRELSASGERCVVAVDGRFQVRVTKDKKTVSLGEYDTAELAAEARDSYLAAPDKAEWLAVHRAAPQSNGTSGYRGVSLLRQVKTRQWLAYANVNGKRHNLGRYDTAEEAAAARRVWDEEQAAA